MDARATFKRPLKPDTQRDAVVVEAERPESEHGAAIPSRGHAPAGLSSQPDNLLERLIAPPSAANAFSSSTNTGRYATGVTRPQFAPRATPWAVADAGLARSGAVGSGGTEGIVQRAALNRVSERDEAASGADAARENRTGLPDTLKSGVESLSGLSLDDVRVHYGSAKPAQVGALAYTQGSEVHVGPGQEQHLAHEAWHVVQQKQGRVKPTLQAKGLPVNDDEGLEREADLMGEEAARGGKDADMTAEAEGTESVASGDVLQLKAAKVNRSKGAYLHAEGTLKKKGKRVPDKTDLDVDEAKTVTKGKTRYVYVNQVQSKTAKSDDNGYMNVTAIAGLDSAEPSGVERSMGGKTSKIDKGPKFGNLVEEGPEDEDEGEETVPIAETRGSATSKSGGKKYNEFVDEDEREVKERDETPTAEMSSEVAANLTIIKEVDKEKIKLAVNALASAKGSASGEVKRTRGPAEGSAKGSAEGSAKAEAEAVFLLTKVDGALKAILKANATLEAAFSASGSARARLGPLETEILAQLDALARLMASASAEFSLGPEGISLSGEAVAEVIARVQATASWGVTFAGKKLAEAEVSASAEASAKARVEGSFKVTTDGLRLSYGVEAHAGASAEVAAGVSVLDGIFAVKVGAGVKVGVGYKLGGEFALEQGKLTIGFDLAACLGIGGSASFRITIDFKAIGDAIWKQISKLIADQLFEKARAYVSGLSRKQIEKIPLLSAEGVAMGEGESPESESAADD